MRILFVSSEAAPHTKTGGLGDVAYALPAALRETGHEVLVFTPRHRPVDYHGLRFDRAGILKVGSTELEWRTLTGDRIVFLDVPTLFDRETVYGDHPDEHLRWAALCVGALEWCRAAEWRPDVVHANDWHTGLIPALLAVAYRDDPLLGKTASVFTIHNLGYQGRFPASAFAEVGLAHPEVLAHPLVRTDHLGFLELGIAFSDLVTTVSPTYAREIQTPEGGAGLDWLLRARAPDLVGILNGIDTSEWNPRTDRLIPFRYSERSLWRKEWNKQALCGELGLPYRKGVPMVGTVSRLVSQKGFDIVEAPLRHFLDTWDLRVAVLGSGEARYEELFARLAADHPDKVGFRRGYDNRLAHLIEAGCDIFLMPSLYEPCGLNQMYSHAYGTVPVVRKVGGLADTVRPFDGTEGDGFVFEPFDELALGGALGSALAAHLDRKLFRRIQQNAMEIDHSWRRRATDYVAAYRRALEKRA